MIGPPASGPTVLIGGRVYHLEFSLGAQYRLQQSGIDTVRLGEESEAHRNRGHALIFNFKCLAAMAGQRMPNGSWVPIPWTAEQLADMVPLAQYAEVTAKIGEAMTIAAADAEKLRAATNPAPTAPPEQPVTG